MPTFILIPGAGGIAWYWHRLIPLLEALGHEAIAMDLPADDPKAGLNDYADHVVKAIGDRPDNILVAQSLAGFVAPLVCARASIQKLVFVNAMIPTPHERLGAWGEATGSAQARREAARQGGYSEEFEEESYFLHDLPPEIANQAAHHRRDQAETIWAETCDFAAWPNIPMHVIAGASDRLFPLAFQRRIARDRLALNVDALPGGHLIALSQPTELAKQLAAYLRR
ncbi:alpha/beta fold hydrolase [Terricaulis sp.]|uniref:alpha/beta fold hydrolase n=1 Tax=Terricaulis sp. TaxID=2768686 RepID=UPI002AC617A7|nr:alpha/beta fold hydrolase [Terricaulis sp.]MDZ4690266.1 alpha/beta fold hydrolase [Terricaulis sp.]